LPWLADLVAGADDQPAAAIMAASASAAAIAAIASLDLSLDADSCVDVDVDLDVDADVRSRTRDVDTGLLSVGHGLAVLTFTQIACRRGAGSRRLRSYAR
jgi:hypothetical protein